MSISIFPFFHLALWAHCIYIIICSIRRSCEAKIQYVFIPLAAPPHTQTPFPLAELWKVRFFNWSDETEVRRGISLIPWAEIKAIQKTLWLLDIITKREQGTCQFTRMKMALGRSFYCEWVDIVLTRSRWGIKMILHWMRECDLTVVSLTRCWSSKLHPWDCGLEEEIA